MKGEIEMNNEWISVKEKKPEYPCLVCNEYGQIFIPSGIVTMKYKNGEEFYSNAKYFDFEHLQMMKNSEIMIYPDSNRISYWMKLPSTNPVKDTTFVIPN